MSPYQGSEELGPRPGLHQSCEWGLNPVRGVPRLPARLELNTGGLTQTRNTAAEAGKGQGAPGLGPLHPGWAISPSAS